MDEGYLKFECQRTASLCVTDGEVAKLGEWRERLYHLGLVGFYENGVGFGNLSVRAAVPSQFIITGSRTGRFPRLNREHYARVLSFDLDKNLVVCQGVVDASSESLTHGSMYRMFPDVGAVIHVHSASLWEKWLGDLPTTRAEIPNGTPEMAREIGRLLAEPIIKSKRILIMGGHRDGILAFGRDPDEAGEILLSYVQPWCNS